VKKVKQILTLFLGLYLLMAMGGFSLYHHICSCNNSVSSSIFAEASCCETTSNGEMSCSTHSQTSCDENGCGDCSCETIVEVLATDYTITSEAKSGSVSKLIQYSAAKSTVLVANQPAQLKLQTLDEFEDKSPPKAGKELVILHQSLKILHTIS
jgi:hypothetical protein